MPQIQAVLFDIDGTLIDSNDLHIEVWLQVFAEAGHAFDRKTVHDQIGKGGDNLVPALLPDSDEAMQERLSKRHGAIFKQQYLAQARPFPHARDLLARVHGDGRKVVLASSASRAELDHYIDLLDARALVDAGTSINDVTRSKPAPDIFATALDRIGLDPRHVVAVGDTPYDADAARKSGIGTVGLLSGGFAADALTKAGAGAIYADIGALFTGYAASPLAR